MFGIVPCRIGGHGILRGFAQRCILFFFLFLESLFIDRTLITNSDLISILRTIIRFVNQRISLQHYLTLSSSPHKNWKFQLRSWIPPGFSLHLPSRVCLQLDNFSKHIDQRRKVTDPKREVCRENFINSGFVWVPHVAASVEHRSAPPILYSVVGRERIWNRRERGREGERSN